MSWLVITDEIEKVSPSRLPSFASPFPNAFYGLFTGWIEEINSKDFGNVPSGAAGYPRWQPRAVRISSAKVGHTQSLCPRRLTVGSSGRRWMCLTFGRQGSHVTLLHKHARQDHTSVTAHTVNRVKGQQGDTKRHRDSGGGGERCGETEPDLFHTFNLQNSDRCKPYGVQEQPGGARVCVRCSASGPTASGFNAGKAKLSPCLWKRAYLCESRN